MQTMQDWVYTIGACIKCKICLCWRKI